MGHQKGNPLAKGWLSERECFEQLKKRPQVGGPLFTWSTLLEGWTDSTLGPLIGIDDHGFHRGDGVFEALRLITKKPYLFESHYLRLKASAHQIGIEVPLSMSELNAVIVAGAHVWAQDEAMLRVFVTRGPGGFSTSPAECIAPQMFVVIMPFKPLAKEKFENGVRIGRSAIDVKHSWLATTKSLNYLPNVMMKKESLQRGLDFTVAFDENGCLAESSTENIVVLAQDGVLSHPPLTRVLRGCTMARVFDLVEAKGLVRVDRKRVLREVDLIHAQGVFMVGTTLDVVAVVEYEGHKIPLSPWAAKLRDLIQHDQFGDSRGR